MFKDQCIILRSPQSEGTRSSYEKNIPFVLYKHIQYQASYILLYVPTGIHILVYITSGLLRITEISYGPFLMTYAQIQSYIFRTMEFRCDKFIHLQLLPWLATTVS